MSTTAKPKFLRARLMKRIARAESLAGHPRKGAYWRRQLEALKRRLAKLGGA